jgi:hypothetical protein
VRLWKFLQRTGEWEVFKEVANVWESRRANGLLIVWPRHPVINSSSQKERRYGTCLLRSVKMSLLPVDNEISGWKLSEKLLRASNEEELYSRPRPIFAASRCHRGNLLPQLGQYWLDRERIHSDAPFPRGCSKNVRKSRNNLTDILNFFI